MRRAVFALLGAGLVSALVAAAPTLAQPAKPEAGAALANPRVMPVLTVARLLELDMSASEAADTLLAERFDIDQIVDLPPDGLIRMLLAVPEDDDCIPRGAPFVCPAIRVFLLNDPQRGHRVTRIEAYQTIETGLSVAAVFAQVASSMGPPLQTEMWPEQVRGGAVVVWRQRWRDGVAEGPLTEVLVTQEAPSQPGLSLADPNAPATGVGLVLADTEVEGAFAAVRRRLRPR